jgi:hypothetical protein
LEIGQGMTTVRRGRRLAVAVVLTALLTVRAAHALSWSEWQEVQVPSGISAAANAVAVGDKVYLFGRWIETGAILFTAGNPATADWSRWAEVLPFGQSDSAVSPVRIGEDLLLFAKGTGNSAIFMKQFAGGGAAPAGSGWIEVPGGGRTGLPPAAVMFQDKLHVFAAGTDDSKVYLNVASGSGEVVNFRWSGWSEVPGNGRTDAPMTAAVAGGQLLLFAKGAGIQAIFVNRLQDGYWSGWTEVSGGLRTDTAPAVVSFFDKVHLFAINAVKRKIDVNALDSASGKWEGWSELPGEQVAVESICATVNDDALFLFAKLLDRANIAFNRMEP